MTLTLPDFKKARVLIVGDVMVDRYWHGNTSRISPEAPVPVLSIHTCEDRPGGAANVALNMAHLNAQVQLSGITGNDETAFALESQLSKAQIHCHFFKDAEIQTITKLRAIAQHQQLIRLDFEKNLAAATTTHQQLLEQFESLLTHINILVLSDYAKGTLLHVQDFIQRAITKKIPIIVDPKGSDFHKYKGATLITPNLKEFELVVGPCQTEEELIAKGNALLTTHQWQALLITRGEQGMTLLQQDHEPHHFPAQAKEVFDVTGAGDTVIATLAAAIAAGAPLIQATQLANIAAGIVVSKLGTASVTAKELAQTIEIKKSAHPCILTEMQLLQYRREAYKKNEVIVMTNGCFDLLHPGHISYLEAARQLGDRLIVAVNDDTSVSRLKGSQRPINSLADRMTLLAALHCVDWVVSFSEDTPKKLIENILPDILVKGGDYTIEQISGADAVLKNNGQVTVIPFIDGYSSTQLIQKIKAL